MNRSFLTLLLMIGSVPLLADSSSTHEADNAASAIPGEARCQATEAAKVFTKEGYRLRDGEWLISLAKGESRFLKVTLFAGERYAFIAATPVKEAKLAVTLFDPSGQELKGRSENSETSRPSVDIEAKSSGIHVVKLECLDTGGSPAVDTSLIYAYK